MRNWLALLLLIPMCLLTIGGTTESSNIDTAEPTEETILDTTEQIIEETTVSMTVSTEEPTIATEVTTEPPVIETEPPATTEPDRPDDSLISLGTFKLTAYCGCRKCCGKYADNRPVDENGNVIVTGSIGVRLIAGVSISVDPSVIPYGTQVVINGHTYIAHDTGGNIKGNRIDVYFDTHQDALNFGAKKAEVFIYG